MKKIVQYQAGSIVGHVITGQGAIVKPINHPSDTVSNTGLVYTSDVVSIGENGVFETAYSHYVPKATKEIK